MGEGATIDPDTLRGRIAAVCRELGLDRALCSRLLDEVRIAEAASSPGGNDDGRLQADIEEARADKDRLAALEGEVLRLLGSASPDEIIHNLRNVLNNLALLHVITRGLR